MAIPMKHYPEKTVKYPIFLMFSTRHIDGFSTNLRNLRSLEVIDFVDGLKKEFLMYVAWGHLDLVSASRMNQTSWQIEQFSAQSMQGSRAPLSWQTQAFEPVDQIVSEQNQMEMNPIGQETVGRDIAQRKAFFEFLDIQFASGSGLVEMPYAFWTQWKIGNKGVVKVILEFPERELIVFFFGFGTADYDETMRPLPVVRLVSKPGYLPSVFPESMIAKALNLFLNGFGHFGNNYVTNLFLVERLDEFVVEEPRVGTNSDSVEVFGNLLSAGRPKRLSSACRMGISRTQEAMPGIAGMAFETNQGMITGTSRFGGVVSNLGSFDFPAKERQDSRIQIEDETAGRMRQAPDLPAQQIVNPDNSFQFQRIDALEEFSQGGRLGEILQSQQSLKTTVVMKNSRIGNTSHTSHHRINNRQNQLGRMVIATSVLPMDMSLEEPFQIQFSTKLVEKEHSAKVSKRWILEEKLEFSNTFSHLTDSVLIGRFLSYLFYEGYYTSFSSEIPILLSQKHKLLPFFQVYIGDDKTDEDAFKALEKKGLTIFVGEPKVSYAKYYLKDTGEVFEFLQKVLVLLNARNIC